MTSTFDVLSEGSIQDPDGLPLGYFPVSCELVGSIPNRPIDFGPRYIARLSSEANAALANLLRRWQEIPNIWCSLSLKYWLETNKTAPTLLQKPLLELKRHGVIELAPIEADNLILPTFELTRNLQLRKIMGPI